MRLTLPDDDIHTNPELASILADIVSVFGRLPNLFRAYAIHPALLRANWAKTRALMVEDGTLPRRLKEAIALSVSHDNGCAYCVAAHGGALQALGLTAAQLQALQGDLDGDGFAPRERTLIRFARHANRDPLRLPDTLVAEVRAAGWSETQCVEALGVVELFVGFNRFLDSFQVSIDF